MSEQTTSGLARLFRGATRIEPDEARAAILSFCFLFLLMLAYNMLKPVRDALAPEWSDVELASLWTINFVFSAIAVSIYGYAVSRGKLQKVIPGVYGFFAASFVASFFCAERADARAGRSICERHQPDGILRLGRSALGFAALRRTHGPLLARRRPLRRHARPASR